MSHLRSWGREFCHTFKRYGSKKKKKKKKRYVWLGCRMSKQDNNEGI